MSTWTMRANIAVATRVSYTLSVGVSAYEETLGTGVCLKDSKGKGTDKVAVGLRMPY